MYCIVCLFTRRVLEKYLLLCTYVGKAGIYLLFIDAGGSINTWHIVSTLKSISRFQFYKFLNSL